MIRRFLVIGLALVALLSFAALGSACDDDGDGGGGDTLTIEEFFAAVDALDEDLQAKSAEVDAEGEALGEDATVDEFVDLFGQQIDLLEEFVNDMDALEEPAEATDLVEEAVSAGSEVVRVFREGVDAAADAESIDEFFTFFEEPETTAAFERFDQVCLDAEALAADNDITVDLNCEEE